MADFYTASQLKDIMSSHQASVAQMQASLQSLYDAGIRSVQLWSMAVSLVDSDEREAAGQKFYTDALSRWEANRSKLAGAIDALALALGTTRQAILDEVAQLPDTNFS